MAKDRFVSIGSLDKRIELYGPTEFFNGMQTIIETGLIGRIWAEVNFISDGERFSDGAVSRGLTVRFIIRNRPITMNHEIQYDGNRYNIIGIKPVNKQFTEISAGVIIYEVSS